MTKKEFKKYRKDALQEIHYQHVYEDGVIEVEQGVFTKTYACPADILSLFDCVYKLHTSATRVSPEEIAVSTLTTELTYFEKVYYLTVGVKANSYDESLATFEQVENMRELKAMPFMDKMRLLHAMYQNDDSVEDRYNQFALRKKEVSIPSEFAACMKNFKRNRKISKDLILPMEMKVSPTEMEFEGNYVRFFYLKNMPRYLTKEFIEDITAIQDVFFSIHLKPLNQEAIAEYAALKFETAKELKDSELIQRQFFEAAIPELKKSAKKNEEMFLITWVFAIPNDSIDELDIIFSRLVRAMENTYVLKELKFQQKNALYTILPFCDDRLDIQTTIYKNRGLLEVAVNG